MPDSTFIDTLPMVVREAVPVVVRDSNRVEDIASILGERVVEVKDPALCYPEPTYLPWFSVLLFLFIGITCFLLIRRYHKEIFSVWKVLFYPALFNNIYSMRSVHLKRYIQRGFIFFIFLTALLSHLYFGWDNLLYICAVTLFYPARYLLVKTMGLISRGRRTSRDLSFYISIFYANCSLVLAPCAMALLLFGDIKAVYILIFIVLCSYYILLFFYFYEQKFSFRHIFSYLCIAEVSLLAIIGSIFYLNN